MLPIRAYLHSIPIVFSLIPSRLYHFVASLLTLLHMLICAISARTQDWAQNKTRLAMVISFVKKVFFHLGMWEEVGRPIDEAFNPEAERLRRENPDRFAELCAKSVADSIKNVRCRCARLSLSLCGPYGLLSLSSICLVIVHLNIVHFNIGVLSIMRTALSSSPFLHLPFHQPLKSFLVFHS